MSTISVPHVLVYAYKRRRTYHGSRKISPRHICTRSSASQVTGPGFGKRHLSWMPSTGAASPSPLLPLTSFLPAPLLPLSPLRHDIEPWITAEDEDEHDTLDSVQIPLDLPKIIGDDTVHVGASGHPAGASESDCAAGIPCCLALVLSFR